MSNDPKSMLNDTDWKVRQEAVRKLELGDKSGTSALIGALKDESIYIRMAAARALGKIADPSALSALQEAMNDEYFMVRQNAMWSISQLGVNAKSALGDIQAWAEDTSRFAQGPMTVDKLAGTAVKAIENAITAAEAPVEEAETSD